MTCTCFLCKLHTKCAYPVLLPQGGLGEPGPGWAGDCGDDSDWFHPRHYLTAGRHGPVRLSIASYSRRTTRRSFLQGLRIQTIYVQILIRLMRIRILLIYLQGYFFHSDDISYWYHHKQISSIRDSPLLYSGKDRSKCLIFNIDITIKQIKVFYFLVMSSNFLLLAR
jgi:hypothetical protein